MPRTYIKIEYFQFIEMRGSVTIDEFKNKFGIPRAQAATWLSKWAGRGYLTWLQPKIGIRFSGERGRPRGSGYSVGPKWWGELVYGSSLELL